MSPGLPVSTSIANIGVGRWAWTRVASDGDGVSIAPEQPTKTAGGRNDGNVGTASSSR